MNGQRYRRIFSKPIVNSADTTIDAHSLDEVLANNCSIYEGHLPTRYAFDGADSQNQPKNPSRRGFLKWGVASVVVAAAIAGAGYIIPEILSAKQTPTSQSTSTSSQSTVVVTKTTETSTSTTPQATNRLYFYNDPNLNNKQENTENIELLPGLEISQDFKTVEKHDGYIEIPQNSTVELVIAGTAPNGKPWSNCTINEPTESLPLPRLEINSLDKDLFLGLADGAATSPIKPSQMDSGYYNSMVNQPQLFKALLEKYYPPGWPYEFNYYWYGYKVDSGATHLSFDVFAKPGTQSHAVWGGKVVPPLVDWKFGIQNEVGIFYYNHIKPLVSIGDFVSRYHPVGPVGEEKHVHISLFPNRKKILDIFTTLKKEELLASPLKHEKMAILPYFET